jgi:hypothetical protein
MRIVCAYAPQSGRPAHEKEQFYAELRQLREDTPEAHPLWLAGDFNAIVGSCRPGEEEVVGAHCFRHEGNLTPEQEENRGYFVNFCKEHDMVIMNTFFEKEDKQLATYKKPGQHGWCPPWSCDRFAQLDYIVIPRRWRHSIRDVTARFEPSATSDHAMLLAIGQIRLKAIPRTAAPKRLTLTAPAVNKWCEDHKHEVQQCESLDQLVPFAVETLQEYSVANSIGPRQSYLSKATWDVICERDAARADGDNAREVALNRRIKQLARKDKKEHMEQLLTPAEEDPRIAWKTLRYMKKAYVPCPLVITRGDGSEAGPRHKAEALAEYLEQRHWAPYNPLPPAPSGLPNVMLDVGEMEAAAGPFTADELNEVLSRLKPGKAAGPDTLPPEFFKHLSDDVREHLLRLMNATWAGGEVPSNHLEARIAMLWKGKGPPSDPETYRPIALLNVGYKVYAALIKIRLERLVDSKLDDTQHGFRRGRSTAQPLFLAKRVAELAAAGQTQVVLLLLDWEKALYKITVQGLLTALGEMGIPQAIIDRIKVLYEGHVFLRRRQACSE